MPKGLTSREILDKEESQELVLDMLSFSGGENTIGQDHELEANEARLIENWEASSLGGMIRSMGFESVASGLNAIEAVDFTGTGLDDATSGGTYSGVVTATFTVIIDGTGTPDTFKWKKGDGAFTETVAITGGAQTLSDGVTITFAATTGHTLADQWTIKAVSYTAQPDLLIQHFEGTNKEVYGIVEGDLVIKDGANLKQEDAASFTSGVISHGVSAGDKLWVTNPTDNLKYKTIGNPIATPTTVPPTASERIYEHNFRLVAEGNSAKTVYGSVPGKGNWAGAGGWTTSNSAWSIVIPDLTKGCVPGFPSGGDVTVFTESETWVIYNQPNVARRKILNGIGCSAPYSIARGNEGIYLVSKFPTLGVFLWNGVDFFEITKNHDFVKKIDFSKRIYGCYRNQKYYLIYNDSDTTDTYPNRMKVYDAKFGRWFTRNPNPVVADNFGYPALLTKTDNQLYIASSRVDKVYEIDNAQTSDDGNNTIANYLTKVFTSRDFMMASGGQFPLDNVRIKIIKATALIKGVDGLVTLSWEIDRGKITGAQNFSLTAVDGDLINTTFITGTSSLVSFGDLTDKRETRSIKNSAVGREFQFQIGNIGSNLRTEIKRIKIHGLLLEDL